MTSAHRPTHYLCPACREKKPAHEFPYRNDPRYQLLRIRLWCTGCLLARGHITRAQVRRLHAAREKKLAAARARVRVYERAVELLRACDDDPEFAEAIQMAARLIEDAREQPLPQAC